MTVEYFSRDYGDETRHFGRLADGHVFEMGVMHDCDHPGCPANADLLD